MTIVPSGKMHIMKTQKFANPLSQGFDDNVSINHNIPSFETEQGMDEDISPEISPEAVDGLKEEQDQMGGPEDPMESKTKGKTLSDFIFKKLESFGYPGRRLQEFKSKFVRESVSPEGVKDIQVEIPDKKYPDNTGQTESIENEDLGAISKEINQMFGLNFNGAERTDGKWTIKFTSAEITNPDAEGGMVRDNLDEVYGKPTKPGSPGSPGNKEPKPIAAHTLLEMIKDGKNGLVKDLIKVIGE